MPAPARYRPEGFHSITPYLIGPGAAALMDFLKQAFEAEEIERHLTEEGTIMHAQVRIGDSMIELSDGSAEWPPRPAALHLYVPDVDAAYARAIAAGGKGLYPPDTKFYGDRDAGIEDPSGNQWFLATRVEQVSPAEMKRRRAGTR